MDGKANIYDIARLTGTTIAAVSRAFDPKGKIEQSKREAILKAAEKYGYRPNRAAGRLSGKAIKIGCLLIANIPEYYEELVAGIKNSCAKLSDFKVECDIRLVPPDENGDRVVAAAFEEYLRGGADGVITNIKYTAEAVRYISLLSDAGIPCATVTSDAPESRRLFRCRTILSPPEEWLLSCFRSPARPAVSFFSPESAIPTFSAISSAAFRRRRQRTVFRSSVRMTPPTIPTLPQNTRKEPFRSIRTAPGYI